VIRAWRIAKARHQGEAFSGAGGLLSTGRWHAKGDRVVYAASSLALAALEVFVHLNRVHTKIRWVVFEVGIPDTTPVVAVRPGTLPRTWRREPPLAATMRIGTQWLRDARTAVMRTPSAIIPTECNYLLNPSHSDFRRLRISTAAPFSFDSRMWK
jgi:RES domain-containing protein